MKPSLNRFSCFVSYLFVSIGPQLGVLGGFLAPEFRLTFLNLGTIFSMLGASYIQFRVLPKMSRQVDEESPSFFIEIFWIQVQIILLSTVVFVSYSYCVFSL